MIIQHTCPPNNILVEEISFRQGDEREEGGGVGGQGGGGVGGSNSRFRSKSSGTTIK